MKSTSPYKVLLTILLLGACGQRTSVHPQTENSTKMDITNKEKAVALLNSFNTGGKTPISYINPTKYIQHNLSVGDGLEGFGEVMKNAPEGGFKANVIRAYQDGDFVFTHTEYDFFGPKAGFDVFRFEDGKIVEHWDNLTEVTPPNPSGRTQFDGPTEAMDNEKTASNKEIVKDFITSILMNGDMQKVGQFFDGDAYIQHNPTVADGLTGLAGALEEMAKQGITMEYHKIHYVLGEGNFVLAMSEGAFAGEPTAYYDLFRVANGKIAEHWDVMAPIPPKSAWQNTNGKF